jgi:hypothetical protein
MLVEIESSNLSEARQASLRERLNSISLTNLPNGATFHAWQNIVARASRLSAMTESNSLTDDTDGNGVREAQTSNEASPVAETPPSSETVASSSQALPATAHAAWVQRARNVRNRVGQTVRTLVEYREQLAIRVGQARSRAPKLSGSLGEATYNQWVAELTIARQQGRKPEYETENVLGDAATKFGVELEFRTADTNAVARRLYDLGLSNHPEMVAYHHNLNGRCSVCTANPGKWVVERDGSVTQTVAGRNFGGEIVSPILSDTPENWEQLKQVSEAIQAAGGEVDHNTGQHVHISTAGYGIEGKPYRNLAVLLAANEDVMFRMASPEVDHHRGIVRTDHSPYHYAQPVAERVQNLVSQPDPSLRAVLTTFEAHNHNGHYMGLNLQHVKENEPDKSRVEFRHFNGSIDPVQIQTNVRLAAAMVHTAAQPDFNPQELAWQPLGNHKQKRRDNAHSENIRDFLDRLNLSESGAKALLDTFLRGKWQRKTRPDSNEIQQAVSRYAGVR